MFMGWNEASPVPKPALTGVPRFHHLKTKVVKNVLSIYTGTTPFVENRNTPFGEVSIMAMKKAATKKAVKKAAAPKPAAKKAVVVKKAAAPAAKPAAKAPAKKATKK
jgi:hypothetical protein